MAFDKMVVDTMIANKMVVNNRQNGDLKHGS
jgi:hypothetical protein